MALVTPGLSPAEKRARYSLLDGRMATVLVGSHATVGMIVRLFKLGVVDYLRKPLDRLHLSRSIMAALQRDQALRAARAAQEGVERLPRLTASDPLPPGPPARRRSRRVR